MLIVQFSKIGTTKEIAQKIKKLTKNTLVRIELIKAYSEDYQETVDIVRDELDNRNINLNTNNYDTIL